MGHHELSGCIHDSWNSRPSRPHVARLPRPTRTWDKGPSAIAIWHPAPGIAGNPGVTEPGIPIPAAVGKRIPRRAGEIWPPQRAVARIIEEAAVVIEVADAISVGCIAAARIVILLVLPLLLIPGIECHRGNVFRERKLVPLR